MDSNSLDSVRNAVRRELARLFPPVLREAIVEVVRLRGLAARNRQLRLAGGMDETWVADLRTDAEVARLVRRLPLDEAIRLFFLMRHLSKFLTNPRRNDATFSRVSESILADPTALNVVRQALSLWDDES